MAQPDAMAEAEAEAIMAEVDSLSPGGLRFVAAHGLLLASLVDAGYLNEAQALVAKWRAAAALLAKECKC